MNESDVNIKHLARLANISIDEQQQVIFRRELSDILNMISGLKNVITDNITPLAHALSETQPLSQQQAPHRTDSITEQNQRDRLLNNAPCTEDGLYIVPSFMETE